MEQFANLNELFHAKQLPTLLGKTYKLIINCNNGLISDGKPI